MSGIFRQKEATKRTQSCRQVHVPKYLTTYSDCHVLISNYMSHSSTGTSLLSSSGSSHKYLYVASVISLIFQMFQQRYLYQYFSTILRIWSSVIFVIPMADITEYSSFFGPITNLRSCPLTVAYR